MHYHVLCVGAEVALSQAQHTLQDHSHGLVHHAVYCLLTALTHRGTAQAK